MKRACSLFSGVCQHNSSFRVSYEVDNLNNEDAETNQKCIEYSKQKSVKGEDMNTCVCNSKDVRMQLLLLKDIYLRQVLCKNEEG